MRPTDRGAEVRREEGPSSRRDRVQSSQRLVMSIVPGNVRFRKELEEGREGGFRFGLKRDRLVSDEFDVLSSELVIWELSSYLFW